MRAEIEPHLIDLRRQYGFHPRDLDTLTLRELGLFINGLRDLTVTDPNGDD